MFKSVPEPTASVSVYVCQNVNKKMGLEQNLPYFAKLGLCIFLYSAYPKPLIFLAKDVENISAWKCLHNGWYVEEPFAKSFLLTTFSQYQSYFVTLSLTRPIWRYKCELLIDLLSAIYKTMYSKIIRFPTLWNFVTLYTCLVQESMKTLDFGQKMFLLICQSEKLAKIFILTQSLQLCSKLDDRSLHRRNILERRKGSHVGVASF